jgi:hypothetical protein
MVQTIFLFLIEFILKIVLLIKKITTFVLHYLYTRICKNLGIYLKVSYLGFAQRLVRSSTSRQVVSARTLYILLFLHLARQLSFI